MFGEWMFVLKEKMKNLKLDVKRWNKEVFGNVNQEGELLQNKIQELDAKDDESVLDEFGREERRFLLVEQSRNMFKQEVVLHKKARLKWLKQSDLNTKIFLSSVKWRRMRNRFNGVEVNSQWCDDKKVVKTKVIEFFEARFVGEPETLVRLDNVQFNTIFDEDNELLVGTVSEEEVKNVVWSCDSSKSPGSDGFNFSFIKLCWVCIKEDVVSTINDFMVNGRWPRGSNASFNPQQLSDYRPILLVGCMDKIFRRSWLSG